MDNYSFLVRSQITQRETSEWVLLIIEVLLTSVFGIVLASSLYLGATLIAQSIDSLRAVADVVPNYTLLFLYALGFPIWLGLMPSIGNLVRDELHRLVRLIKFQFKAK